MNEPHTKMYSDFVLPLSVVSKLDISRLVNEFERIDDELTTAAVRARVDSSQATPPVLSTALTDFLNQNQLRPSSSHDRTELIKQLHLLKDNAPVIHMTFAVEADGESLQQLAQWLRAQIHPQAVIDVGLQPALIAGVYLRTPNRVQDLSLREALRGGHQLLVNDLEALRGSR